MFRTRSRALASLPRLENFLDAKVIYTPFNAPRHGETWLSWGRKVEENSFAEEVRDRGASLIRVEDGFLAYLRHPSIERRPISLIFDQHGIYYDASKPSDLEVILATITTRFDSAAGKRTSRLIELIRHHQISKYNLYTKSFVPSAEDYVLVVDQSFQDRSVHFGGGDESSFEQMLSAAITENPSSKILLKVHPDAYLKGKKTYLKNAIQTNIEILSNEVSLWSVLQAVRCVYTVSSQVGFEALIAGKDVHCFGLPFYAGWGLTKDRIPILRRRATLTLEQLVYGALVLYPRYIHPLSDKRCQVEDVVDYLCNFLKPEIGFYRRVYAVGMSFWKRQIMSQYLTRSYCQEFRVKRPGSITPQDLGPNDAVLVWGHQHQAHIDRLSSAGATILRAEDGFIRSVGLGSDLKRPSSLVVSRQALHYNGRERSDIEQILQREAFSHEILRRSEELIITLQTHGVTKYNLKSRDRLIKPKDRHLCLVIGQVPGDAALRFGSETVHSDSDLLLAVRDDFPSALLYYKPHPDVVSGNRKGELPSKDSYDVCIGHHSILEAFRIADSVHVISSLAGFEALLHQKSVYTYGRPFYAGWGLTIDREVFSSRKANKTLIELVAASLLLHPIYFDWQTRRIAAAEDIVTSLIQETQKTTSIAWGRFWLGRIILKLSYALEARGIG